MKSKTITLIALLFAVVFLVSSAIAIETSKDDQEVENPNQFGSQKQYGCRHGCCRYDGYRCAQCCYAPKTEEASLPQNPTKPQPEVKESNPVNDEKYGGGGGWHGGGGHGGGGWHGGGGHGGGGWHGGGGRGGRCCGKDKESNQAKP